MHCSHYEKKEFSSESKKKFFTLFCSIAINIGIVLVETFRMTLYVCTEWRKWKSKRDKEKREKQLNQCEL